MKDKDSYLYIPDNVVQKAEQDTFGHTHTANAVVQSILNTSPPFIIGIFGGWGTGKSSILTLIEVELKDEHVRTVWIDAWRYSSAENLKRAFLVHVANEINPDLLDDLQTELYTTQQESILQRSSKLDHDVSTGLWETVKSISNSIWQSTVKIWKSVGFIFLILVLFFVFLAAFYLFRALFTPDGIKGFSITEIFDTYIRLAFIPSMLAIMEYLRRHVFQQPVIVTHERIDADERFAILFRRVVKRSIEVAAKNVLSFLLII